MLPKECLVGWVQMGVAMHPPPPYMRVEHDHSVASHSDSATGSVGLSYSTGVPRSG
jgi:hypothetical protein